MKTISDFSAYSAWGLGGAVRRAAMMLLMMMLTTLTAWANDYTVTYKARFVQNFGSSYSISLERVGNTSLYAHIATSSSGWSGGYNVCVDDEYDITFTPSSNLTVDTDPLSSFVFTMSSGDFTARVANTSSYSIKQVRLLNGSIPTGTVTAAAPNSKSATVSGSSIRFNIIEVTLTDDFYGTITPYDNLTIDTEASLTYDNTNYYQSGATITMKAPANFIIDKAQGNINATIAADKRSYTFEMPKMNVTLGAETSEVHTISCPSGLTVTTNPYFTYNSTKYYKKGQTYTLTADADKAILSLTASGASGSSIASDKRTATVTMGSSDVTVTATFQTISGTTDDGLSWSLAQDVSGNYTRLTISGTGAMKTYNHTTDGQNTTWRTNAPWGWLLTSVSIGNGVTKIGNFAFCGCQNLATAAIGSSVATIGENAFDHCDAMNSVALPASVTTLGANAFKNCTHLQRIDIGHNGAITLGNDAVFKFDNALQYIVFPSPEAALANTTDNWSGLAEKLRVEFGSYLFTATDEGGSAAYEIANADDLRNLATAVNAGNNGSGKTFRQTDDIDFKPTENEDNNYTPIGDSSRFFKGTYDGQGHTISGIRINKDGNGNSEKYQGLFGRTEGATIQGITLTDADITGKDCTGGIVGFSLGTVSDCHVAADVYIRAIRSDTQYHGGIVGRIHEGTVSDCTSAATLTNSGGGNYYGGIAGYNAGTLSHNLAIGAVVPTASDNTHGAICGKNSGSTTLQNNYYHACKVASNDVTATGVGCNNADVTNNNGTVPAFLVTLADGVTNQTAMADDLGFTYGGNDYWRTGAELTLVLPELGEAPEGYQSIYITTAGTLNGTTLTVGSADATVSPAIRSDGQSHTVSYIKADGTTGTHDAIALDETMTTLAAGWYYVGTNINYTQNVNLDGNVTIILGDGCTMNVGTEQTHVSGEGISGFIYYSFSIYAQSTGNSKGQLYVNATDNAIDTKDVTISGGQVTANGNNNGIYALGYVTISGGQVTANGDRYHGIYAYGNVTLGWTSLTDFIQASSYYSDHGSVSIAQGKVFKVFDGETLTSYLPSGTLNEEEVTALGGKTLRPYNSPRNLTVTDITSTSATLTWEAGHGETQWQVSYSIDNGATWTEPATVTTPTYSLTGLTAEATVVVKVQPIKANGEADGDPANVSFIVPFCEPENQCAISYTLGVSDPQYPSWYDATIKVVRHETGAVMATLTYTDGADNTGELFLCDGKTYDFVFDNPQGHPFATFTLTGPDGYVIADYSSSPDNGQFAQYTLDCNAPMVPQNLAVSDITPTEATVTWQPGGNETQWAVSYREANAVLVNENFDNLTSLPYGWVSYNYSSGNGLTPSNDWYIDNGVLTCTNSQNLLFIPIQFGGKAFLTMHGSSNNDHCSIGCVRDMNSNPLDLIVVFLSETSQEIEFDMSAFEGNGYLFIDYYESNTVYIEQIKVTGPAWSEPILVNEPEYTIAHLAPGQEMQVSVQSVCDAASGDLSRPVTASFTVPQWYSQYLCAISYELADSYGDGWNGASIAVVRADDGKEVASLTMTNGATLSGELPLCPGEYNFIWKSSEYDYECSFTIYDPDGNERVSVSEPSAGPLLNVPYVHSCGYDFAIINNSKNNSAVISENDGESRSVMLQGRTLYKDGAWNTLCLPFAVALEDSSLEGATLKELDTENQWRMENGEWIMDNVGGTKQTGLDTSDGTLYLFFTDAESIVAGKPYLIRWEGNDTNNLVDPIFYDVVIDADASTEVSFDDGSFIGIYDRSDIFSTGKDNFYLGSNNKLYYPWADGMEHYYVNALRAYFHINDPSEVRAFSLSFGDGSEETQGIVDNKRETITNNHWYTLDGVRLDAQPTRKGLYIHGGRKVVVK